MKVLVTGANGFIGRAVVRACLESGYQVVAAVRTVSARHNLVSEAEDFPEHLTLQIAHNLSALADLLGQAPSSSLTAVVHCAGAAHASRSDADFYKIKF